MEHVSFSAFALLVSGGLVFYAYMGYPALLWMLTRILPARVEMPRDPPRWPTVSVILSALNEEAVIEARIRNLTELDYPGEIEVLIGSDGSTDCTCEIVRRWVSQHVRLVAFPTRRGKASVLNDLIRQARSEIVVLTDANTFFRPNAVQELVQALWQHPNACAVVGQLDLRSLTATGNLDGMYWRYESWIKSLESRFGCVLGANGAIYAFWRARYRPLSAGTIVDDFQIPLCMRLHEGGQVFFVPTAQAWEASPTHVRDEFSRRVRIGAGDLQALLSTWPLLLPWKGMIAVVYFSHKVLRWFGPWFLLVALGANLILLSIPVFRLVFAGQVACYGLALFAPLLRGVPLVGLAAAALRYFLVLNSALLLGFVQFALGVARPSWNRTSRQAIVGGPAVSQQPAGAVPMSLCVDIDDRGTQARASPVTTD